MNGNICKPPLMPDSCNAQQQRSWLEEINGIDIIASLSDSDKYQLIAIIASSSHLHRMAKLFASDIPDIIAGNAEKILLNAQENWEIAARNASSDAALAVSVRLFRNRCHFIIALSELWHQMDIASAYTQLSKCAEYGLQGVASYLHNSQKTASNEPATRAQWVILGLGKLGAGELNYSSDIDLIILHDFAPCGRDEIQDQQIQDPQIQDRQIQDRQSQHFISLTRRLAKILSEDTPDGFGWRVDFRLRPDPAATPLSLSFEAAVSYYESTARSWERAAFIRARPVAGDIELGQRFLASISAFIWRRSFDYTVIDDLQVWLRHIPVPEGYLGFDVKLGQYGIRHIELLVHILQLLGGGRHPELRCHNTSAALNQLVCLGWLDTDQADALHKSYFQWRIIEHRIQYLRDTQTHKLPRDANALSDFARFCGLEDKAAMVQYLKKLQKTTSTAARHPIFDQMLAHAENRHPASPEALTSAADHELSQEWLASLGFVRPHDIRDIIDGWSSGRLPATRGERARHYLFRLLPNLITSLAKAAEPDAAFARFADFIAALPAGAQAFSLLCQHPQLTSLITDILVKAPALANMVSRRTDILDIFLEPHFFAPLEEYETLAKSCPEISRNAPVELYLDKLKRWAHEAQFRANVHLLQNISPATQVTAYLSDIAELSVQAVSEVALRDFQSRYGQIAGSNLHILALGRLGCQTMTARSDIDLLFIYDGEAETLSDGAKPLGLSAYYIRLTQLIISWLTVASSEGSLYEVDTRLRPDGKSGPAASHISRLKSYYETEAWPWEHIAFAKARLIHSSDKKRAVAFEKDVSNIQKNLPALPDITADIIKMREKLSHDLAAGKTAGLSLKKRAGGFLDIEFLAMIKRIQYGAELSGEDKPPLPSPLAVLTALQPLDNTDGLQACIQAVMRLEALQAYSQICLPRYANIPEAERSEPDAHSPSYQALAEITGYASLQALLKAIEIDCKMIEKTLLETLKSG